MTHPHPEPHPDPLTPVNPPVPDPVAPPIPPPNPVETGIPLTGPSTRTHERYRNPVSEVPVQILMSPTDLAVIEASGMQTADWLRQMYDEDRLRITPQPQGPPLVEIR